LAHPIGGGPIQRNACVRWKKLGTLRTGPWLCSGSPLDLASEAPFPVRHEKAQVGLGSSAQVLKTPVVRLLQLTESARLESRALHVSKACGSSAAGCYGCKFIYAAAAQVCETRVRAQRTQTGGPFNAQIYTYQVTFCKGRCRPHYFFEPTIPCHRRAQPG
jgi:hypothetical protein